MESVQDRLFDVIHDAIPELGIPYASMDGVYGEIAAKVRKAVLDEFPVIYTDVEALKAELEQVRGSADAWWSEYDKAETARQEAESRIAEPEWEYGYDRGWGEPRSVQICTSEREARFFSMQTPQRVAVRRRKAGDWEEVN